jgi:hypothetical protein
MSDDRRRCFGLVHIDVWHGRIRKAENCETVRAGMGLLIDGEMGKQRRRDRWLGMEKTQYHSLRCFSGYTGSIQLVLMLPQLRSYRQRHR